MDYKIKKQLKKKDFENTKWKIKKGQGSTLIAYAIDLKAVPNDGYDIVKDSRMIFFEEIGKYPACCMVNDKEIFEKESGKVMIFDDYFEEDIREKDPLDEIFVESHDPKIKDALLCDLDGDSLHIFKRGFKNIQESVSIFIKLTKKELKDIKKFIGIHQFGKIHVFEDGTIFQQPNANLNDPIDKKNFEKAIRKSMELLKCSK